MADLSGDKREVRKYRPMLELPHHFVVGGVNFVGSAEAQVDRVYIVDELAQLPLGNILPQPAPYIGREGELAVGKSPGPAPSAIHRGIGLGSLVDILALIQHQDREV